MKPKISIIIPICNTGRYLEATLASVIRQSLKDIEIICVDDYSTDNSRSIIEKFCKIDERIIKIYHKENLSTSQSRKDGVLASRGEYIMFLDGDDELTADACQIAYDTIEQEKTDIVQFRTEIINCANVPNERIASNLRLTEPYLGRLESDNLVFFCWKDKYFRFQIWNKIYNGDLVRKAFLDVEDGSFPKAQDLYAFFIIAFYAKTYVGIENVLYKYKFGLGVTGGNIVTLSKYQILLTEKYVGDALARFIKKKGLEKDLSSIVNEIQENFVNECYNRWLNNLEHEHKSVGFKMLCDTFGFTMVLNYLTKYKWNEHKRIIKALQDVDYFKYLPRPGKKCKTIAAYYRCISNGGAQRVVALLCNRWAAMKDASGEPLYNVVLITDEGSAENEYPLHERIKRAYLPPYTSSYGAAFAERSKAWEKIIEAFDIDVVVSSLWVAVCTFWDMLAVKGHSRHPAFMIHAHSFCGIPFVFQCDEALQMMFKYEFCDGVVALSQCDEYYISAFNHNTKWITNPLAFKPSEIDNSEYKQKTLVWCGRISEEKRPLDVIKAMQLVVKEVPDAKLYIVGDGNPYLLKRMKEFVKDFRLDNNVSFTGFSLDVDKYYKIATAILVTSEYEGFSLVMGEAMAHAVPVISYEMPYLSFMRDGRGLITVPQGEYMFMAQEAVRLLQEPEMAAMLGKAAKQHITDVYNADIEGAWQELFSRVDAPKEDSVKLTQDIVLKQITECQAVGREKALQTEKSRWQKQIDSLNKNLLARQAELDGLRAELVMKQQEADWFRKEWNDVKTGLSFRIGRIITYIPRKIFGRK